MNVDRQLTATDGPCPPVIGGEVLDHGQALVPTQRRRFKQRPAPWRPRRWPWVLTALWLALVVVVGVPAVLLGMPILRDTVAAGRGASTPAVALTQWMFSFEHGGRDGEMLADRIVISSQRRAVGKVRHDFIAARDADAAAHPDVTFGPLKIGSAPPDAPAADWQANGNRATVLMYVKANFSYDGQTTPLGYDSESLPWRAEARKQRDGWRLWSVTIPPWCGRTGEAASGYARCNE